MDSIGWGSPFLLVPEATSVDPETLTGLGKATAADIQLQWASPLGVRFWQYVGCSSELARRARVDIGRPGSTCPKGYCAIDSTYEEDLCRASRGYQRRAIADLDPDMDPELQRLTIEKIVAPTCICHDLGASFRMLEGVETTENDRRPTVCPGPNLANFSGEHSLDGMVGHIYGRENRLSNPRRSHVFINEARLYLAYLREQYALCGTPLASQKPNALKKMRARVIEGLERYGQMLLEGHFADSPRFAGDLSALTEAVHNLPEEADVSPHELPQHLAAVDAS